MGPGEFLSIDLFTALFTLANTIALFLVLKKFLFKPVLKMIDDRQKEIDDLYADAEQAKDHAQAMEQEYTQKLAEATDTGERLVKEAVQRGQSREEEIIRQANAEADAIRKKADADIERQRKKAINDAKNEISGIAMEIASKVVEKEIENQNHEALVEEFIEKLGDDV